MRMLFRWTASSDLQNALPAGSRYSWSSVNLSSLNTSGSQMYFVSTSFAAFISRFFESLGLLQLSTASSSGFSLTGTYSAGFSTFAGTNDAS